nr:mitotic checkpoint serine/threonine-protein kinase BUB1-like isoform X1 [Coffea arabica]
MAVISQNPGYISTTTSSAAADPLLSWLWSIEKALIHGTTLDFDELLSNCIKSFSNDPRYKNDVRFLKIWFLHMDRSSDYESVFREMEKNKICSSNCSLYEWYALFLEAKGKLIDAYFIYHLGISRNAEPIGRLKKAQVLFLERVSDIVMIGSVQKVDVLLENGGTYINPWLVSTTKKLLQEMNDQILKYEGYYASNKPYKGKVALSTLQKSARNKTIEIGGYKYQIKGCAGQGGFAQVFKAHVDGNPDDVVALKIQKPAFPWEFYMYRLLDMRIPESERMNFGFAHRVHLYSDYSILVSDYLAHGTLQDAINSNLVTNVAMEEELSIYYTIKMLRILETLHDAAIIHGDFKPDNLMIRYSRRDLLEDKDSFYECSGPWKEQGLCLVDWGRGIDLRLFPDDAKLLGDCRTSGFRCIEMQENKPWTFQVDTYGLCVIVHMMLHKTYMEIEKRPSPDGGYVYQPKTHLKRYMQVELWKNLFMKLLNTSPTEDHKSLLRNLRHSFQDYMCSNPQLIKKLKQLLVKQKNSLCSA